MWSKWIFSVNQVKHRTHDAPHTLLRSGAMWELLTGDDGVGLGEPNIYHYLVDYTI